MEITQTAITPKKILASKKLRDVKTRLRWKIILQNLAVQACQLSSIKISGKIVLRPVKGKTIVPSMLVCWKHLMSPIRMGSLTRTSLLQLWMLLLATIRRGWDFKQINQLIVVRLKFWILHSPWVQLLTSVSLERQRMWKRGRKEWLLWTKLCQRVQTYKAFWFWNAFVEAWFCHVPTGWPRKIAQLWWSSHKDAPCIRSAKTTRFVTTFEISQQKQIIDRVLFSGSKKKIKSGWRQKS